jgi:hypothetical protein
LIYRSVNPADLRYGNATGPPALPSGINNIKLTVSLPEVKTGIPMTPFRRTDDNPGMDGAPSANAKNRRTAEGVCIDLFNCGKQFLSAK